MALQETAIYHCSEVWDASIQSFLEEVGWTEIQVVCFGCALAYHFPQLFLCDLLQLLQFVSILWYGCLEVCHHNMAFLLLLMLDLLPDENDLCAGCVWVLPALGLQQLVDYSEAGFLLSRGEDSLIIVTFSLGYHGVHLRSVFNKDLSALPVWFFYTVSRLLGAAAWHYECSRRTMARTCGTA